MNQKQPMKRLVLLLISLVVLPVLLTSPALNAPPGDSNIPDDDVTVSQVQTAGPSSNSTITITMHAVDE